MSLIKKSDLKNHLSTRTGATVLPIQPAIHSDATGYSEDDPIGAAPGTTSADNARVAEAAAPAVEAGKPKA
jgi:hypothetical protein